MAVRRSIPGVSLVLSIPALLFQLPGWAGRLQLDREAVARGEIWRLVTCHWTHWSARHLLWNLAVFAVLAVLCESRGRRAFLAAVVSSALLIPPVLWIALPDLEAYRGLSGIDSALFVLAAMLLLREEIEKTGSLRTVPALAAGAALVGFLLKVGYESVSGAALFAGSEGLFVPLPLAHLAGGACGLWAGLQKRNPNRFQAARNARNPIPNHRHHGPGNVILGQLATEDAIEESLKLSPVGRLGDDRAPAREQQEGPEPTRAEIHRSISK